VVQPRHPRTFGAGGIGSISGGSSGFIALSAADATRTLWLSSNGRTWTNGTLPADLRKSTSSASDPAAIAGGYVLPGVVLVRTGDQGLGGGAGCVAAEGPINPPVYRGGLWWSTDGRSWIRDNLDGAVDAAYVTMAVTRIDDHTLVAVENGYTPNVRGVIATEWASLDGKAWTLLKGASPYATAITDGTRGLLRDCSPTTDTTVNNWPSLCAIGPGLDLVVLTQRGNSRRWALPRWRWGRRARWRPRTDRASGSACPLPAESLPGQSVPQCDPAGRGGASVHLMSRRTENAGREPKSPSAIFS